MNGRMESKMKLILMVAGAALLSATGALGADQDKDKEQTAKKERTQCRYERVTGSRTKAYRVCLTKSEWNRRAVDEREELERMRGSTGSTGIPTFGGGAN